MQLRAWAEDARAPTHLVSAALSRVQDDPGSLSDADWTALLGADGDALEELCELADAARNRVTDATSISYVVNRNLETAALVTDTRPGLDELVAEAAELGATEICMQGPLPPDADVDYLELIARIRAAGPGMHLHALRPPEVRDAARRSGLGVGEFLTRARGLGLGSVPGTAAQILSDDIRRILAPGPAVMTAAEWIETIETAHRAGLFSTATMVYGHFETPAHQVRHLRTLIRVQERTGGFSELILMPMVASNTPAHLRVRAAGSAGARETRALHAVARLITLGRIDHLQVAWTKLDSDVVDQLLRGGADDIGGLLLDGVLRPEAGPEAGRVLEFDDVAAIADRAGRTPRQRTTGYEDAARHGDPTPPRPIALADGVRR